jgi:hypothetical protein
MKRLILIFTLLAAVLSGCSQNHFNIPIENFAEKVRVLGVAPIFVDADSDIKHPQKDQLISLLADLNRKYEQLFVRKLKATGNFYTVALLDGDPQTIFTRLSSRREKRNDASIVYNKYFWKSDELRDYIQKNNLDAVMLLVISGLTKSDKVTSITQFKSLTSDYNFITMTAQILSADGAILWEYPNFRTRMLSYEPLLNLEFPDFTEAEANRTTSANVKFKTIDGLRRALEVKRTDLLLRETQEPEQYARQFDAIISLLKYDPDLEKRAPVPVIEPTRSQATAVTSVKAPEVAAPPAAPAPEVKVPEITRVPKLDPPPPTDEIVPAKGSTL